MDVWNVRIPMLIPFVGLILGDVNYIIQTAVMDANPYWLMISDVVFGVCGGFNAIIGREHKHTSNVYCLLPLQGP